MTCILLLPGHLLRIRIIVVLLKGYGVRELGKPGKVNNDTIFQLASATKLISAASLGVLVDQGRIGWNDPIVKYLPGFVLKDSYVTKQASLVDLLAHRSGLPERNGDLIGRFGYSNAEIIHRVRHLKPGSSFREQAMYSNIGYSIAGEVAAHIDPDYSTWEEIVFNRLLQPLEMTRSGPYDDSINSDRLLDDLMAFDVGESGRVTGFNAGALGHFKKLHD